MGEIPQVLNVLLLDAEGKRVAVKYYDETMTTVAQQMAYERQIFAKTARNNARATPRSSCWRTRSWCTSSRRTALLRHRERGRERDHLSTVLNGFFAAVSLLLRGMLEKRSALEESRPGAAHHR